jgi:aspartate/methionine/tyrosine aminotransferase
VTATRTGVAATYSMRRWVFEDAPGRYDVDLGESHVRCGTVGQLAVPADLELDYGVSRGGSRLRGLIAGLYGGSAESVLVTHGAQEALYLALSTLLRPGDRVVTFSPGWQSAVDVPRLLGCRLDIVDLGADLTVDPATVRPGADLRMVVLNTPCNPTGRVVAPAALTELVRLVERAGAYLLLDEEYSLDLSRSPALGSDRAVSVSSLSKLFGLPGLRTGWLYGPAEVAAACAERKFLTTVANSVLIEALACDALSRRDSYLAEYHRLCDGGLALLRDFAARNAGAVRLLPPEGTPFGWLWLDTGEPALDFCRRVLDAGVLLLPGETVGAPGGFRVTFAREPEVLAGALRRVEAVLRVPPPRRPAVLAPASR